MSEMDYARDLDILHPPTPEEIADSEAGMDEEEAQDACEHEWVTHCDGETHTDVCSRCHLTATSPCTEAGTWPVDDEGGFE